MLTAVLLAAGRGKRLRPYTDHTPKPLLKVNGRPTLDFVFTAAARAGVTNVCLVTHHLEHQIMDYVGDGSRWGVAAVFAHQPVMRGTGHALEVAMGTHPHLFAPNRPFLLSATDYLFPPDYLADLVQAHTKWGCDIAVSVKKIPPAELSSRSSIRYHGDFVLEEIVEKPLPGTAPSSYSASLIFVLPGAIYPYLTQITPARDGERPVQTAVNTMLRDGYSGRGLVQPAPAEWIPPAADNAVS